MGCRGPRHLASRNGTKPGQLLVGGVVILPNLVLYDHLLSGSVTVARKMGNIAFNLFIFAVTGCTLNICAWYKTTSLSPWRSGAWIWKPSRQRTGGCTILPPTIGRGDRTQPRGSGMEDGPKSRFPTGSPLVGMWSSISLDKASIRKIVILNFWR